jgi:hypothetical protein
METEKEDILVMLNSPDRAQKAKAERKAESLSLHILDRAANFEHDKFTEKGKKFHLGQRASESRLQCSTLESQLHRSTLKSSKSRPHRSTLKS